VRRVAPRTPAAALLDAVEVGPGALGVTTLGDRDDHVVVGDEVLIGEVPVSGDDPGPALVTVLVDDLGELAGDDLPLPFGLGEDVLQVGDHPLGLGQPVDDRLDLHGGQPAQLGVQDVHGLQVVDVEQGLQPLPGHVDVARGPDQRQHLVQPVQGLDQAAVEVGTALGIGEPEQVRRTMTSTWCLTQ
jgi:hypothetical protein